MPSRRVLLALPPLLCVGLLAGCGKTGSSPANTGSIDLDESESESGSAVGDGATARLDAELQGSEIVPGPGDADGRGRATVVVEPGRSQLCYRLEVEGVADAAGTSVNEGSPGETGGVVLGLDPPAGGSAEGCATADPALLERVVDHPGDFYLNVRTDDFPGGAVRGQLASQ